uniref:Uncharacterized protein n=1 Tax=Anguilla anguilla TaxID=7936 RepID=A0A0E9RJP7_ANGAN
MSGSTPSYRSRFFKTYSLDKAH